MARLSGRPALPLVASGTLSGTLKIGYKLVGGAFAYGWANCDCGVTWAGCSVQIISTSAPGDRADVFGNWSLRAAISGVAFDEEVLPPPPAVSYYAEDELSVGLGATWEIRGTAREWVEEYTPSASEEIESLPFPVYPDLAAHADAMPATGQRWWLAWVPGTELRVTVTGGGRTATVSTTIPANIEVDWLFSLGATVYHTGLFGTTASTTASVRLGDIQLGTASADYSRSEDGYSASTAGGCLVTVPDTVPQAANPSESSCTLAWEPPVRYRVEGVLRTLSRVYPGRLDADIWAYADKPPVQLTLDGSTTIRQRVEAPSSVFDLALEVGPVHIEKKPLAMWLRPDSLAARGEDPRDWRLLARGLHWPSRVRMERATHHVLVRSHGPFESRSFPIEEADRSVELYRYLEVSVYRRFEAGPVVVTLTDGWTREFEVPAETTTILRCDLARPMPGDEEPDRQWRYPLEEPGGFPTATPPAENRTPGWGVSRIESVTVAAPGGEVMIDWIRLAADEGLRSSVQAPFLEQCPGWTSPTDTTTLFPFLRLSGDGRAPVDLPYMARVAPLSGAPWLRPFTIAEVATMAGSFAGAEVEVGPSWPWPGLQPGSPAYLLGAGGSWYDHSSRQWAHFVDLIEPWIPAQELFDEIQSYPGCGDPWRDRREDPTPFVTAKTLRGRAAGLAYGEDGEPDAGRRYEAFEVDGPFAGEGTSDAKGSWATGAPHGRGNRLHRVGERETRWQNRLTRWGGTPAEEEGAVRGIHLTVDRRRAIFYSLRWDDAALRHKAFRIGADRETTILAPAPIVGAQIAVRPDASLLAVWSDGSALHEAWSGSIGKWWQTMGTIGNGTFPAVAVDPRTGMEYCASWTGDPEAPRASADWVIRRRSPNGTWQGPWTIGQAEGGSVGLEVGADPMALLVFYALAGDGIVRRVSASHGEHWEDQI